MKKILFALLLLSMTAAFGQTTKYRWRTELCEYEGYYDKQIYSETQLNNTYKMWFFDNFRLFTPYNVWKIQELEKLSVKSLDSEYQVKSKELKKLDIAKTQYWETFRQHKIKKLDEEYKIGRINLLSYKNPEILRQYSIADSCIKIYAEALISGGDKLLEIWRQVHQKQMQNNGDPENLDTKFKERYNSNDSYKYARIDVMNFGWWNCAITYLDNSVEIEERGWENYSKLFNNLKTIECDEP